MQRASVTSCPTTLARSSSNWAWSGRSHRDRSGRGVCRWPSLAQSRRRGRGRAWGRKTRKSRMKESQRLRPPRAHRWGAWGRGRPLEAVEDVARFDAARREEVGSPRGWGGHDSPPRPQGGASRPGKCSDDAPDSNVQFWGRGARGYGQTGPFRRAWRWVAARCGSADAVDGDAAAPGEARTWLSTPPVLLRRAVSQALRLRLRSGVGWDARYAAATTGFGSSITDLAPSSPR